MEPYWILYHFSCSNFPQRMMTTYDAHNCSLYTLVLQHSLTILTMNRWRSPSHRPTQHYSAIAQQDMILLRAPASWFSNQRPTWIHNSIKSSWITTYYYLITWFRNLQLAAARDSNIMALQHPCASTVTVPSIKFFSNIPLWRCCDEGVRGICGRQDVSHRGWI